MHYRRQGSRVVFDELNAPCTFRSSDKRPPHFVSRHECVRSYPCANLWRHTRDAWADAHLGHGFSVVVHAASTSGSKSETNSVPLHPERRHRHPAVDALTSVKLPLFLSIASLLLRQVLDRPSWPPTNHLDTLEVLTNTLVAHTDLETLFD